ncbi:RluA family pseudouridine synthase [Patescibacteria group bacterium]
MNIPIIYEDENILAIDKPSGLLVHPAESTTGETLIDWILEKYPDIKNVGEDISRPGIVHRLDKETSGTMLVAKDQETFEFLKEQFQNRKIKKTYSALVTGEVKNNTGTIETPIQRFTKSRDALTEYKITERFKDFTLLEAYPKTGRTHQIRIHLKSIGHPIVCDKIYTKKPQCPFGLNRHFLHAQSIEFNLENGSKIKLETDLPKDLDLALKSLKEYAK